MKIGDLVKLAPPKGRIQRYSHLVGLIVDLPDYDLIVEVMWSDGQRGHINTKYLEVINENRQNC